MNISQNISNIYSKQCDFGLKAAALCKENYPIPSCSQLRQSCLYTSTYISSFLWYQTSFPVSEGNFWLLKQVSRSQ